MLTTFEELVEKKRLELSNKAEDQFMKEGMELIDHIEKTLSKLNYVIQETVHIKYMTAINRDKWDKQLIDELKDVKAILDGKQ